MQELSCEKLLLIGLFRKRASAINGGSLGYFFSGPGPAELLERLGLRIFSSPRAKRIAAIRPKPRHIFHLQVLLVPIR